MLKLLRKLKLRQKEHILQRTRSQAVEAYLEKIKDIPKEKLVYIDETGI